MHSKYPPSACMHALRQWNGCINDALFQCCVKSVADAVAMLMMSRGAVGTLKRLLLLLLLVFCCRIGSMTPITETHHRHLSSARFFAVSYPCHMLLISCSLFLPVVRFPVILPSRTSRNNTSCRRTCPSHLRFR